MNIDDIVIKREGQEGIKELKQHYSNFSNQILGKLLYFPGIEVAK